jgi:hypothetical protein
MDVRIRHKTGLISNVSCAFDEAGLANPIDQFAVSNIGSILNLCCKA